MREIFYTASIVTDDHAFMSSGVISLEELGYCAVDIITWKEVHQELSMFLGQKYSTTDVYITQLTPLPFSTTY